MVRSYFEWFVGLWFDAAKAKIWSKLIENNYFPDDDYEDDSLCTLSELNSFIPKMDTNGFYKLNGNHKCDEFECVKIMINKRGLHSFSNKMNQVFEMQCFENPILGCLGKVFVKIGEFVKLTVTTLNFQTFQNWQLYFRNALEGKQGLTNQNGKIFEQKEEKRPRVPRFMTKNGQCNIKHDAKEKTKRFLQDFFTTIVDMEWHYRNNIEIVQGLWWRIWNVDVYWEYNIIYGDKNGQICQQDWFLY